jgi:predicted Zn finger-like uncharacterized protein
MILTCPECASRYFVDDQVVGRAGRTVRCTSCGTSWKAEPEDDPLELTATPDEGALGKPPADEPAPGDPPLSELPADRLPGAFRAKAEERRRIREAAAVGAICAGIAAAFILVLVVAAIFRTDIVRLWPKTASAYAAVGMPVNATGITIEKIVAQPGLQDGRAAVVVTGALRNIRETAVTAPALRINLLNKAGKTVQGKIAAPADPEIPPGETRHFTITLLDPPSSATDVEVVFETARTPPAPRRPAKAPVAAPPLRQAPPPLRPPVEEAKPLQESDPLAVPATAPAVPHG